MEKRSNGLYAILRHSITPLLPFKIRSFIMNHI